jgi:hypothetical protein
MPRRITEMQWLAAGTLHDLDLLGSAPRQYRRWRLFAVACCRRAMGSAPDTRFEVLAEAAERFADGGISWEEMKAVRRALTAVRRELGEEFGPDEAKHSVVNALDCATAKTPYDALGAAQKAQYAFAAASRPEFSAACAMEEQEQLALARDIFGNPFRPIAFDYSRRTADALGVARAAYEDRASDRLPLLADALMDAGCTEEQVIAHCRGPGPHVRGCWVLDLVLGKT